MELPHPRQQIMLAQRITRTDAHLSNRKRVPLRQSPLTGMDKVESLFNVLEQHLSLGSQLNPLRRSEEQLSVKLRLQLLNRMRNSRLCNV
jgi:hypothetical protein